MANTIKLGSTIINNLKLGASQVKKVLLGTTQVWANLPDLALQFVRASNQWLSMSSSDFGSYDRAKFSISMFVKRDDISNGTQVLYAHTDAGTNRAFDIFFLSSNELRWRTSINGSTANNGDLIPTATFTSTSAYYHFLFHYDSANATAGDRMRMWVDGTEVTSFSTDTNPTAPVYNAVLSNITIGANDNAGGSPFNGKIYYPAFFSGVLVPVTDVRDSSTGLPKDVSQISGLVSALDVAGGSVVSDLVLATDWTNNNSVTSSSDIPA